MQLYFNLFTFVIVAHISSLDLIFTLYMVYVENNSCIGWLTVV